MVDIDIQFMRPIVIKPLMDISVNAGTTATLTCHVRAWPRPIVTWGRVPVGRTCLAKSTSVTYRQDDDGNIGLQVRQLT